LSEDREARYYSIKVCMTRDLEKCTCRLSSTDWMINKGQWRILTPTRKVVGDIGVFTGEWENVSAAAGASPSGELIQQFIERVVGNAIPTL
jgi:hypothetical protein